MLRNMTTTSIKTKREKSNMARFHDLAKKFSAPNTNYVLPTTSKKEAISWIVNLAAKRMRFFDGKNYWFCWNVKLNFVDCEGHNDTFKNDPKYDEGWKNYWEENENTVFPSICEEAAQRYVDGEYTSYPGADQGDWKFSQMGKSGGWMVLTHWRGNDLRTLGIGNLEDWLYGLEDHELYFFFVGLVCLEHDLSRASVRKNISWYIADHRFHMEAQWKQEEADAAELEAKRERQRLCLSGLIFDMKAQDHQWGEGDIRDMTDLYLEIGGREENLK
jgi:hypothetical protein